MITEERLKKEYIDMRPLSQSLHREAVKFFSANGATHFVRIYDPYRPYITHAEGSRKWDIDGNEYLDYVMGHGAMIFGHSHPDIVAAIKEQAAKGLHYGENHELEIRWAGLILSMMPSMERIEFCSCGQEANMLAIRLARIFTGRRKVLRFEENFHGWADELASPETPGIISDDVIIISGNDLNLVEKHLATKKFAILITEGGGASMGGMIPWEIDFIRSIPELTQKYGTVWLMDEVVTGFRDSPGGWQEVIKVEPDLTTMGKIIGGGLGAGAVCGRSDIFDTLKPKAPPEAFFRHSGTWNANPLTAAAGAAACKLLKDGGIQKNVNQKGAYLRKKGNKLFKDKGFKGRLYGRSIIHIYLGDIDYEPVDNTLPPTKDAVKLKMIPTPERTKLGLHLLHRGIATTGARNFIISTAHSYEDIDLTINVLSDSVDAMI